MKLSAFLNSKAWEARNEFGIEIEYQGKKAFASVTEYLKENTSVFLATLNIGKEVLLFENKSNESVIKWIPVDMENLDLASVLGEGIECGR
jgi:hypothetical protein